MTDVRQLAVVTGAASGVGLATTQTLADRGTAVVGVDLDERPGLSPGVAGWVRGDVSHQDTWDRVQDVTEGQADCLVACAGTIVVAPFLQTKIDDWLRLYEINVLGVVRGMQTLLPAMLDRGSGAIAVVCSVNSLFAEDQMSAYSTSKAALLHAVRSAALEYAGRGVRINAVCPGAVDTPLLQRHLDTLDDPAGALAAVRRRTPTGELVRPHEVAETLCFLVSPAASGLSGAVVTVDGGLTSAYDFHREQKDVADDGSR